MATFDIAADESKSGCEIAVDGDQGQVSGNIPQNRRGPRWCDNSLDREGKPSFQTKAWIFSLEKETQRPKVSGVAKSRMFSKLSGHSLSL